MSSTNAHRSELGEFLRARRGELSPRQVGLPEAGAVRRVPGLRREEVAQLAVISTDYYTRLEQGRIQASAQVLSTIARVLQLDDDQRDYLFELAGKDTARPRRRARQKVQPPLQRVLDDLVSTPAIVIGRRMDILAWNPLAAALLTDFSRIPDKKRNYIRLVFTDPAARTLYEDWETVARTTVAQLRMEAADSPDDPELTALVGELAVQDAQFRRHHPVVGDLTLDWNALICATDRDQQLITWTAEPGSPSHDALRMLASWAAEHLQPAHGTAD